MKSKASYRAFPWPQLMRYKLNNGLFYMYLLYYGSNNNFPNNNYKEHGYNTVKPLINPHQIGNF